MRRSIPLLAIIGTVALPAFAVAQTADVIRGSAIWLEPPQSEPAPLPVGDAKKPVVSLLEDDSHLLIPYLTNDQDYNGRGALAAVEDLDVFAGASALRVGPLQRFRAEVPGWSFPVRETPKAGEFRYIRFAWKKVGGTSITLQLHTTEPAANWRLMNYYAGKKFFGWNLVQVSETMPTEWTVVTRDLFKDFGKRTITGLAYTTTDGTHGLFDHILLGRTVEDLDKVTDAALGKVKPDKPLAGKDRDEAWADLWGRERAKAGQAIGRFLAAAPDQVGYVRERLAAEMGTAEQQRERAATITRLIGELNADKFDTREAAEDVLRTFGTAAEPALLAATKSESAEVRFRARRLLLALWLDGGESLTAVRATRVVRVLERAGTADAKSLLTKLAEGEFGTAYQAPAKATVARLK